MLSVKNHYQIMSGEKYFYCLRQVKNMNVSTLLILFSYTLVVLKLSSFYLKELMQFSKDGQNGIWGPGGVA